MSGDPRAAPGVRIAIDGPAGSGKSTTALGVALRLGFRYVDSGALYRVATLLVLRGALEGAALAAALGRARVEQRLEGGFNRVLLDGEDVSAAIRELEVARGVSRVAAEPEIRRVVTAKLRQMAAEAPTVMDGRDIGTVVAPDAPLKIWLDASVEVRARRRSAADRRIVAPESLARRDALDRERATAPLATATDAVVLLVDDLTLEEQVARIVELHQARVGLTRSPERR